MSVLRSASGVFVAALAACGPVSGVPGNGSANASQPVTVAATPAVAMRARPEAEQRAEAFEAVFGKAPPFVRQVKQIEETTSPLQLIWRGDRAVLITKTELDPGCHYCGGSIGIYYLTLAGDTFTVTGKFPRATLLGSFGQAPTWSVSNDFGPSPTLVARNGTGGQGYACGSIELTELAADRPRRLVKVPADFDGTGDGPRPNPGSFQLKAEMGKVVPGKSFTMHYTGIRIGTEGAQNFSETYVRTANGYVVAGKSKLQPCHDDIL